MYYTMAIIFIVLLALFLALDVAADRTGWCPTFSDLVWIWGDRWPVIRALYVIGATILYFHFWCRS